jgi:hypothetical protein
VVVALPPFRPDEVKVLSEGFRAAGGPVVDFSGERIVFVGKLKANDAWQIYEVKAAGGKPRAITAVKGGVMSPAIASNGDLVFSSPVPKPGTTWNSVGHSALYAQSPEGPPRRLTFGSSSAIEPTVLGDGRILFVSARPSSQPVTMSELALFTINKDGTEFTAFALDRDPDGFGLVQRPRELRNGQIGFIAAEADSPTGEGWAEAVRTARPFASRAKLFNFPTGRCRSIEPGDEGELLACLNPRDATNNSPEGSFAVYRLRAEDSALGQPLFDDPAWNDIEATRVAPRKKPMGHISAMSPAKKTGTILCLDAAFSRAVTNRTSTKAARVRVLASGHQGSIQSLGEVTLREDGSFLAEVPADVPLGFESLDPDGRVLHRVAPGIWVRPGENRSCVGCHAPYNRSPRNLRPLAAFFPPVPLLESGKALAQQTPSHEKP